ncbi:hypothetical protein RhiirA5_406524 [Rhizophagus irregularis]|uniref:Uncharacterized protein n=1 Tax=Rhizophagus irregularis TaxID=588596 RepID=A0A2N0QCR9_9GLOM|nr:hypothetical protein RhiirA5_406524 [Rhizophagus irregularis]
MVVMGFDDEIITNELFSDILFIPIFIRIDRILIVVSQIGISSHKGCYGAGPGFLSTLITKYKGKQSLFVQSIEDNCNLDVYDGDINQYHNEGITPNEIWKSINILNKQQIKTRKIASPFSDWSKLFKNWYEQNNTIIQFPNILFQIYPANYQFQEKELGAWRAIFRASGCINITPFTKKQHIIEFWTKAPDLLSDRDNLANLFKSGMLLLVEKKSSFQLNSEEDRGTEKKLRRSSTKNRILIPQDIDDVFNATTQSLDEIIRQAALMQEIGVDQLNQIEGLQTLLGESLDHTNTLNQDLIRTQRCSISKPTESAECWRRRHAGCIRQAQNWQRQYRISQTQVQAQAQNILNLQQQILALQNNPPNMATIQDVMHTISPGLAQLPFYDGQEPPDSYYQKLRAVNEMARPLAFAGFNAAMRCNVMKNKMSGRFIPVPVNNPYNGNAPINTEPEFLNWLQGKYRDVMVGTNQGTIIARDPQFDLIFDI